MESPHKEKHKSHRANWLRAAVLGADDGIVSTSSIMLGVIAAQADTKIVLATGIASLFAGAFSMAAGEYVSVSSQRDAEKADIAIERRSLAANPDLELTELARIYIDRGLEPELAREVAQQLHDKDAIGAHARDELGINSRMHARPCQAAAASAVAFAIGSAIPLAATILFAHDSSTPMIIISLAFLAVSGLLSASIGGGNRFVASLRVLVGGGIAMAVTYVIGHLVGISL